MQRLFSAAFAPPLLLALWEGDMTSALRFAACMLCSFLGGHFASRYYRPTSSFHRDEALAVVAGTWLSIGVFAAVPYVLSGLTLTDALFESISGITTTGATVITDFTAHTRSFFLWRAMTQWFGGLGVIALFVVVLPKLGIAGRQMFFAEASGAPSEAVTPQIRKTAGRLWIVYTAMTCVLAAMLYLAGMTPYDALVHSLTTLSAGGFSPNPESIAGFHNPTLDWILVVFMLLAGASFTLQYKVYTGRLLGFFRDGEFIAYVAVMSGAALGIAWLLAEGVPGEAELRAAFFQSSSLMSSTGFASTDYNLWADGPRALLIIVMLVGGCAGSAAGGPKVVRLLLVLKHVMREFRQVLHPRAVIPITHKSAAVPDDVMRSVFMLVVLFFAGHFLFGTVLVLLGSDLVLGYSAALACFGNIGPGFGAAGPMGSFAGFSAPAKWVLTGAMWIGRLEIVTVLALLHPDVWRHAHLHEHRR